MLDNHGYPTEGKAGWDDSTAPGTIPGAPARHLPAGASQPAGTEGPDAVTIPLQPARARRSDRVALRIGVVAGVAALIVAGTALTMAAAPSPGAGSGGLVAAASAEPSPSASTSPDRGMGPGRGGFNGGRGMGPGMGRGMGPGMGGFGGVAPMMGGGGWSNPGQPGGRMRGGKFGAISITAISGDSLALKTEDGWTRTITITSATTITKAGATITTADLAVGDTIRFSETRNSDGTYAINAIAVVVPQATGSVTAVDANGFTIKDRGGISRTVSVNGSTVYGLGTKTGSKSDVTVGTDVIVAGPQASDGSMTALRVTIILPRVSGQVTATSPDGFTLTRPDGTTLKVNVGSDTAYQVAGKTSATLADVSAGMMVFVTGPQRSDGSLDAVEVFAGVRGFGRGNGRGGPGPNAAPPAPSPSPATSG